MAYQVGAGSEIIYLDEDNDDTVIATGQHIQISTPPAGYIYQLIAIYYNAPDPAGSTAGTHQVELKSASGYISYVLVVATTGNPVLIQRLELFGNSSEAPSAAANQALVLQSIRWSNAEPLHIVYDNDTDVSQAGTRRCRLLVEKIKAL